LEYSATKYQGGLNPKPVALVEQFAVVEDAIRLVFEELTRLTRFQILVEDIRMSVAKVIDEICDIGGLLFPQFNVEIRGFISTIPIMDIEPVADWVPADMILEIME